MVKGQSALEYMMTYGWAILIIVVVAVVLYSMNIFNPSSATTRVTTGFSPFSAEATICNSTSLTIEFNVLLPLDSDTANITSFSIKSETGMNITKEVTETNLGVFYNGQSFTVKLPASCISAAGFSASGYLNYTLSSPTGNNRYITTGTVAGTGS